MVITNALSVMWLHKTAVKVRRVKTLWGKEVLVATDPHHKELAKRNREKYPEVAKTIDEIRKYFPGAKVVSIGQMSASERMRLQKRLQSPTNHEQDVKVC